MDVGCERAELLYNCLLSFSEKYGTVHGVGVEELAERCGEARTILSDLPAICSWSVICGDFSVESNVRMALLDCRCLYMCDFRFRDRDVTSFLNIVLETVMEYCIVISCRQHNIGGLRLVGNRKFDPYTFTWRDDISTSVAPPDFADRMYVYVVQRGARGRSLRIR